MGTYRSLFFTSLLFGMFQLGVLAQSKDSVAMAAISGAWLMDADIQMEKSTSAGRNSNNKLKQEHFESLLESMRSRVYVFQENGRFESSWNSHGDTQLVYGNWIIRKDGILEIELEDKSMLSYTITLNKSDLILAPGNSDESEALILHLKRFEP
ncbi:hypothetical protein [uncultured Algoriphagus sp.]|uniref:hypothetical protein n=1 Tax=uncultured Algoriphagus sp. TaxID=417365 RepID=UPI0030EBB25C